MEKKTYLKDIPAIDFNTVEESLKGFRNDFSSFFSKLRGEYLKDELTQIFSYLFKNIKDTFFLDALIREIDTLRYKENLDDLLDFLLEFNPDSIKEEDLNSYINLRVLCLKAISNYKDTKSITAILYCLNNKNEHYKTRLAAAEALGKIGDKNAVTSLINVVSDEEEKSIYVRESAAMALGMIGDMRAVDPFLTILEAKKNFLDKFTFLKERVIEALGKFNMPHSKRVLSALKDALLDESPQVRLNTVETLMNFAIEEEDDFGAAELIKKMLYDEDEEVARSSVTALYNVLGESILKEILEEKDIPHHCKEEAQNILETELLEDENE